MTLLKTELTSAQVIHVSFCAPPASEIIFLILFFFLEHYSQVEAQYRSTVQAMYRFCIIYYVIEVFNPSHHHHYLREPLP